MTANDAVLMRLVMAIADEIIAPVNSAAKIASIVHQVTLAKRALNTLGKRPRIEIVTPEISLVRRDIFFRGNSTYSRQEIPREAA